MSVWHPANYPASNGGRHRLQIEGPTGPIVGAAVTRMPQLDLAEPEPEPEPLPSDQDLEPEPFGIGWAAALLPVCAALTMGGLASVYIAVHTEPVYGAGAAVLMVGLVAAIILWGWQQ